MRIAYEVRVHGAEPRDGSVNARVEPMGEDVGIEPTRRFERRPVPERETQPVR